MKDSEFLGVTLLLVAILILVEPTVEDVVKKVTGSAREEKYDELVLAAAENYRFDPNILRAIVRVESNWVPDIVGVTGDVGLAQIQYPVWGPVFGLRPEDLLDPWTNLHVAARILRDAMDQEPGSWGGVGRYHSATPWRKWGYARHVAAVVRALQAPALQQRDRAPAR